MLAGTRRDTIPTAPRWEPIPYHPKQTQAKRREVNDKASRTRRARVRDIHIGDQVIVKDRKPGWKFRTPYEPGVWTVTGVSGTMVTAEKGCERVTRNISWFKKATFVENSGDQEAEDQFSDWPTTESPAQEREGELPLVAGPVGGRQPVGAAPATQCREPRSLMGRNVLILRLLQLSAKGPLRSQWTKSNHYWRRRKREERLRCPWRSSGWSVPEKKLDQAMRAFASSLSR
ncbi:hypothetical protein NDU88_003308 [Pleurodeles waltl]|uniref:Uncharacterized protein n=1 Tax=Pleurodeles waltl TaxID=8319 RepID=A0AAV7LGK9_PLEWA|nr:hypothetical protein NDU88_003308 [Pleurodeles waltl]